MLGSLAVGPVAVFGELGRSGPSECQVGVFGGLVDACVVSGGGGGGGGAAGGGGRLWICAEMCGRIRGDQLEPAFEDV